MSPHRRSTASPPPANTAGLLLYFDVENSGNGVDTIQVDVSWTNGTNVIASVQGYRLEAGVVDTVFANLVDLNAYLEDLELDAGESMRITLEYTTGAGSGGLNADVTLEATSLRDANTDSDDVNVAPSLTGTINVTDASDVSRLPSGGANPTYSVTFPVYSSLAGTVNVVLNAAVDGTNAAGITIVSVNGQAGQADTVQFTYNSTQNITVVYTVANNAAGAASQISLSADGGVSNDSESITVTIVKPTLTVTKQVFTDSGLTTPVSSNVLPGQTLYYRIAVTNTGTADAANLVIEDELPEEVSYVSASQVGALSGVNISEDNGTVTVTRATHGVGATLVVRVTVTVD